jgi:hypothetical protein
MSPASEIDRRLCCFQRVEEWNTKNACLFNFILLSHALHTCREVDHWVAIVFRICAPRWVLTRLNPVSSINQPANIVFVRDFMGQCIVGCVPCTGHGASHRLRYSSTTNHMSVCVLVYSMIDRWCSDGIALLAVELTTHTV